MAGNEWADELGEKASLAVALYEKMIDPPPRKWWLRKPFALSRDQRQRLHTACIAELARRNRTGEVSDG